MSLSDSSFWTALLGGGIVGAVISALATIFFGARWVERSRLKREHSLKLVAETLKPWLSKYSKLCLAGAVYSGEADKLVGQEPTDPKDLPYFDAAMAHLESGHQEILKSWADLKKKALTHNLEVAQFLEGIRSQAAESTQLKHYHPKLPGKIPEEYIIPENASDAVYHALLYEIRNRHKHFLKPKIYSVQEDGGLFLELRMGSDPVIAKARDKVELENIRSLLNRLIASQDNKHELERLVDVEDKLLPSFARPFNDSMKELVKSVELGKCLKGKCKFCP